jgi:hypothetical protein
MGYGFSSLGGDAINWAQLDLPGKRMELLDEKVVEVYRFHKAGHVSVTLGTKDGPLAAPLFYWKIKRGLLVITESDTSVYQEFEVLSIDGSVLTAKRRSGGIAKYTMIQSER